MSTSKFLFSQVCLTAILLARVQANPTVDLSNNLDFSLHPIAGGYGGTALVGNFVTHPAGTGVFDPFLTIERRGNGTTESGYNTDGHSALYLNQQRPEWNTRIRLGDLAVITVGGQQYYAFELDANEPSANPKNLISIDNIRIYTSASDNTGLVASNEANLDMLGTKRFALNDGGPRDSTNWIQLDADQNQGNGGSGTSDMIFYVPISAFAGALATDYVWFYNFNGANMATQAGYEEWRAVLGPNQQVPESGSTLALLVCAFIALGVATHRFRLATV